MIPRTMSHYQLRTECLDETIKTISQNIYITLPVAWAPSQHGGRIPRTSILRERQVEAVRCSGNYESSPFPLRFKKKVCNSQSMLIAMLIIT